MHYSPILAPVVALVAWSIIVMLWMVVTRFAEFRRLGISFATIRPAHEASTSKVAPTRTRCGNRTITAT